MNLRKVIVVAAAFGFLRPSDPSPGLTMAIRLSSQADALDLAPASVSASGRFVALTSEARLVAADENDSADLYVVDMQTDQVFLESNRPEWAALFRKVLYPRISGDGRFVVFQAAVEAADDPVPHWQIALLDRREGSARVISVDSRGHPANAHSTSAAISADGSTVVFQSRATNLAGENGSVPGASSVYLLRVATDRLERISSSVDGASPGGDSVMPAVSGDGRYVAFAFTADRRSEIYLHDTTTSHTVRISRSISSGDPNGPSSSPALSDEGRVVAFTSEASNLVDGDRNGRADVFVYDTHVPAQLSS